MIQFIINITEKRMKKDAGKQKILKEGKLKDKRCKFRKYQKYPHLHTVAFSSLCLDKPTLYFISLV